VYRPTFSISLSFAPNARTQIVACGVVYRFASCTSLPHVVAVQSLFVASHSQRSWSACPRVTQSVELFNPLERTVAPVLYTGEGVDASKYMMPMSSSG
jgi:hypothetical protein